MTSTSPEFTLAPAGSLPDLFSAATPLSAGERREILDQALVLIEQLYVHLPQKRATHAVDPVQLLKLLAHRVESLDERAFHDEMISIFTGLRDMHTSYLLPAPYAGRDAVLPFRVERCLDGTAERYLVTALWFGFTHETFKPGVEITHWNGTRIRRAAEMNGDHTGGANESARLARGLATLTQRPMQYLSAPAEERVVIDYLADGGRHDIRFVWQVVEHPATPAAVHPSAAEPRLDASLGIDRLVEALRRVQKALFAPDAITLERQVSRDPDARPVDLSVVSALPDALQFRRVSTPGGEYGYLRIRTFLVDDVDTFVYEVLRIVELLPAGGLIIDVRSNGGGVIMAAERILQLFTPRRVAPQRLQFINTPLTLRLVSSIPWLASWRPSMAQSLELGATFSAGFPISETHEDDCNDIGQRYHGPVALIVDALCYSATDIFAAGFQDHAIGPVVGIDPRTGAGGANAWDHAYVAGLLTTADSPFLPLPRAGALSVAIRRTIRTGDHAGQLLEEVGVVPDHLHEMTRDDVLNDNRDLIASTAKLLGTLPRRRLEATASAGESGTVAVDVETAGLTRLDAYLDGRPRTTLDIGDGRHRVELALGASGARRLELRGFDGGDAPVATRLIVLR